jgi:kynurenine formamidase
MANAQQTHNRGNPGMRIVDLSRELYHRTPSYPGQPPIIHGVWKTHEESFVESGNVHGNSVMFFSMPDHGGTHIDAPPTSARPARRSTSIRSSTAT